MPIPEIPSGTLYASGDAMKRLRTVLDQKRLTFPELRALLEDIGCSVESSSKGSGHMILRYGSEAAAVVSSGRKHTERWQPHQVLNAVKKLRIPLEVLLQELEKK